MGPLIPLFWTSGDVSSVFQNHSGQPYSYLAEVYVLHIPLDSPLVTPADLLAIFHIPVSKHWWGWKPGPIVIVCLCRLTFGVLSSIKCGTLLAQHRPCKNNRNSGFWVRRLPSLLKGTLVCACSRRDPALLRPILFKVSPLPLLLAGVLLPYYVQ